MLDAVGEDVRKLTEVARLQEAITRIKENGVDWLTNLYVDESRIADWIVRGQASYLPLQQMLLLMRQREGFRQCYVSASSKECLSNGLCKLLQGKVGTLVTDVLGEADELRSALLEAGFQPYLSLRRIVKLNPPGLKPVPVPERNYAQPGEEAQIREMLSEDIDALGEQVPDLEEITERVAAREVLVIRDEATGELKAFFSFMRQGATVTGRFLCTRRKYREEAWGLDLSDMFFGLHADARRILGWVREDNRRNLRLYELQGYRLDRLRDEVLIYRGAE